MLEANTVGMIGDLGVEEELGTSKQKYRTERIKHVHDGQEYIELKKVSSTGKIMSAPIIGREKNGEFAFSCDVPGLIASNQATIAFPELAIAELVQKFGRITRKDKSVWKAISFSPDRSNAIIKLIEGKSKLGNSSIDGSRIDRVSFDSLL